MYPPCSGHMVLDNSSRFPDLAYVALKIVIIPVFFSFLFFFFDIHKMEIFWITMLAICISEQTEELKYKYILIELYGSDCFTMWVNILQVLLQFTPLTSSLNTYFPFTTQFSCPHTHYSLRTRAKFSPPTWLLAMIFRCPFLESNIDICLLRNDWAKYAALKAFWNINVDS